MKVIVDLANQLGQPPSPSQKRQHFLFSDTLIFGRAHGQLYKIHEGTKQGPKIRIGTRIVSRTLG